MNDSRRWPRRRRRLSENQRERKWTEAESPQASDCSVRFEYKLNIVWSWYTGSVGAGGFCPAESPVRLHTANLTVSQFLFVRRWRPSDSLPVIGRAEQRHFQLPILTSAAPVAPEWGQRSTASCVRCPFVLFLHTFALLRRGFRSAAVGYFPSMLLCPVSTQTLFIVCLLLMQFT